MGAISTLCTVVAVGLTCIYLFLALKQGHRLFYPPSAPDLLNSGKPNPYAFAPLWRWTDPSDKRISAQLYLSTSASEKNLEASLCIWNVTDHSLLDPVTISINASLTKTLVTRKATSLYGHLRIFKGNQSPTQVIDDPRGFMLVTIPLTKTLPFLDPNATVSLLDVERNSPTPSSRPIRIEPSKPWPHWKSILRIQLVNDNGHVFPGDQLPGDIYNSDSFRLIYNKQTGRKEYYPIVFVNDVSLMRKDYLPLIADEAKHHADDEFERLIKINHGIKKKDQGDEETLVLPLEVHYSVTSMGWWRLSMQLQESLKLLAEFGFSDAEVDNVRQMLTHTDPYLLLLTTVVSLLHVLFDFLAFKNDIVFFSSRTNYTGLSSVSMLLNTLCQFIILLYLIDNDTPYLVAVPVFIGILIELWKLKRITRLSFRKQGGFGLSFGTHTTGESNTATYDAQAFGYLAVPLVLIVFGYGGYSLLYLRHKGWYSWLLETLTSAIYAIGFILMTPQLFINYKLKSVAHLPWRVFLYKALNTFIDDLFAFIIVMPTLHRLSCFRDDLVFFIYLYQRWMYPVDASRTEGEEHEKKE